MEDKEILEYIIKGKGKCTPTGCATCPLFPIYYVCDSNDTKYKKAMDIYVERFGKSELFEKLI